MAFIREILAAARQAGVTDGPYIGYGNERNYLPQWAVKRRSRPCAGQEVRGAHAGGERVALTPVSNARRPMCCAWADPDSAVLRQRFPVPCPGDFHGA